MRCLLPDTWHVSCLNTVQVKTYLCFTRRRLQWGSWSWCYGWLVCGDVSCPVHVASTSSSYRSTWSTACHGRSTDLAVWHTGYRWSPPDTDPLGSTKRWNTLNIETSWYWWLQMECSRCGSTWINKNNETVFHCWFKSRCPSLILFKNLILVHSP